MPQGLAGGLMSVATATARKLRYPSVTAFPKATLSAQVPTGYDAFSTLAPLMYAVAVAVAEPEPGAGSEPPSWGATTSSVAPTRNWLYGQYAVALAAVARACSSENSAVVSPCVRHVSAICAASFPECTFSDVMVKS